MKSMKALAGLILAVPLLAGCATAAVPTGQEPASASVTDQGDRSACAEGSEAWRTQGPPKRGGTMVAAMSGADHLDITQPGRGTLSGGGAQINQGLVDKRGCFFEDIAMSPRLAKSWQTSPDGLSWTLSLRNDVKWQALPPVNGRGFTSRDVAWTIDHQKAGGSLRSFWDAVSHEEPDDFTVVLRLKEPDADFLTKMGHGDNVIVAREIKEQHGDFKTVAVGTGPYMLKEIKTGREVMVERNPGYYEMGLDGKALPYIDNIHSLLFADRAAELAALRSGQLDHTFSTTVLQRDADSLKTSKPDLRLYSQAPYNQVSFFFKLSKPPWTDVRVRRAVALAINREDLVAIYAGGAMGTSFVPVAFKELTWPEAKMKQRYPQDIEQAKKLLAEANFQNPATPFNLATSTSYAEHAEVIQAQLQEIGIKTQLSTESGSSSAIVERGNFDLGVGTTGSWPFPSFWIGDFVRTGSSLNWTGMSDSRVDALAKAQNEQLDPAKRKETIDQLHERLYELMPYVPNVSLNWIQARSCRLRNAAFVQPSDNPRMRIYAWLDPTGCP